MKTILIADDDVVTRKVVRTMCEGLGHRVIEAVNGQEALDTARHRHVDIVITDWIMPERDGVSLCEALHAGENARPPYVFLITGKKKGLKNYAEALGHGADDFLYKPVDFFVFRHQLKAAEESIGTGRRDV